MMSQKYEAYLTSSMQKITPNWQPTTNPIPLSVLRGDVTAFQVAIRLENWCYEWAHIKIESLLPSSGLSVRQVKLVPASWPIPGMFPDLLSGLVESDGDYLGKLKLVPRQFRALWIEIETDYETESGLYLVTVIAENDQKEVICKLETEVEVIPVSLPKGEVYHTEWFHADCLADYYQVPVFSERHWALIENFVSCAVKRGMNTLLTPTFTYPLDIAEGGERTTIQLVKVKLELGSYQFDFTLFEKWVNLCRRCGIENFEMVHLYSQWGAKYAPKIMVEIDGVEQMLFGWHTAGIGEAYQAFLREFLPALDRELERLGIATNTFFHVSDEPSMAHLESYKKARAIVEEILPNYPIIDALTDFEFYQTGVCQQPIPSNDHITPFLEAGVKNLWTYYCTAQRGPESNRFFHLPSAQARIIGVQIYKYDLAGFLHWGFNFYNSFHSLKPINPYETTDADEVFDAGDPFLVYPGPDGMPEESYRLLMMDLAFKDIRALKLLEKLTCREAVLELVDRLLNYPTMTSFSRSEEPLLRLRYEVNSRIFESLQVQKGENDYE